VSQQKPLPTNLPPGSPTLPREFWIIDQSIGDDKGLKKNTYLGSPDKPSDANLEAFPGKFIHVIEAAPVLERIKELETDLKESEEMLQNNVKNEKELWDICAKQKAENARLHEALDKIDWHIRDMQNEKVISMKEMIVALKVISDALPDDSKKG
jgi:hypothetical protein